MSPRQRVELAIIRIRALPGAKLSAIAALAGVAALGAGVAVAAWPQSQDATDAAIKSDVAAVLPCNQQAWPYIDAACLKAGTPVRQVRVVSSDREGGSAKQVAKQVAANGNPATPATAAVVAANLIQPAAGPSIQPAANISEPSSRRPVTVHYAHKSTHGDIRQAQRSNRAPYRVAGPVDIRPSRDYATDRRWNDDSRRVMAYDDEDRRSSHTFFVPRESAFGGFFQR